MAAHLFGNGNLFPLTVCQPWTFSLRRPNQCQPSLQHCYCHDTELVTSMLTGSVRDPATTNVQFHTNTAYRQYNQLLYLLPTKTSSFVYVLVNQSSEEVNFLLSFVLIFSCFMCATMETKCTPPILIFSPKMKTLTWNVYPEPSLQFQCFVVLVSVLS